MHYKRLQSVTKHYKTKQFIDTRNMYSHKEKLKELFTHLPKQYRKEVCKQMKIEFDDANKIKIWRVRNGLTNDHLIEACLIKIAKKEKRLALKNLAALQAVE